MDGRERDARASSLISRPMSALQRGWARAIRASSPSSRSSSTSRWSIIRRARSTAWRATAGSSARASHARLSAVSSWERSGSPWWNEMAWIRWYQPVCSPTRARRSRTWVRVGDMRRWRPGLGQGAGAQQLLQVAASVRSVLARRLGPRQRPGVGRLRCARNPACSSSLATNRQPVVASRRIRLLAGEPTKPAPAAPRGWGAELSTAGLAGVGVDPVVGDLPAVDVEPAYDGRGDLLWLPSKDLMRQRCASERRGPAHMPSIGAVEPNPDGPALSVGEPEFFDLKEPWLNSPR